MGWPLNLYVVLDFRHTEVGMDEASHVFERLRSGSFVRWLARKGAGCPPAFVWTMEQAATGIHVNWLVHIPPQHHDEFRQKLERWFRRVACCKYLPAGAIHVDLVGTQAEWGGPA